MVSQFLFKPFSSSEVTQQSLSPTGFKVSQQLFPGMKVFNGISTHSGGLAPFRVSVDIKDAYLHVPTFPPYQKFLQFVVEDHHFQFMALLFSLSMAPQVFSRILAPILELLRT